MTGSIQTEASAENARHSGLIPGLELIRGLASIEVFFSHLFLVFAFNNLPPTGRPFWMEAFLTYGSEAVVVFFVLSGLVIALSQRNSPRDGLHFVRARIRRLEPLYLGAVLLGFLADRILKHHFAFRPLWGHFLFLQSFSTPATPLFQSNLPLWSLSFEFYFYLLFALTIGAQANWARPALWIAGFIAMIPFYFGWQPHDVAGHLLEIVAYMPIWLLGVTLVGKPIYFRPSLGQNLVIFTITFIVARSFHSGKFYPPGPCLLLALLIAPLLYSLANPRQEPQPHGAFVSWLIVALVYLVSSAMLLLSAPVPYPYHPVDLFWLAIPPLTAVLVGVSAKIKAGEILRRLQWRHAGLLLGRLSYAIYVVHLPVCALVHYKTYSSALRILLGIGLVIPLAWLFEYRLHPYLCSKFDRVWPDASSAERARLRQQQAVPIA